MTSSRYMAFKVACTAHKLCCTLFLMDFKIWNLKLLKLCDSHQTRNRNEGLIKYQTDESVWSPNVGFLLALLQCSFISFSKFSSSNLFGEVQSFHGFPICLKTNKYWPA